jgi:hypothetical protein
MKHSVRRWTLSARTLPLIICIIGLAGSIAAISGTPATPFTFEPHELVTGVVHLDTNAARHLRLYAFGDSTWAPKLNTTLRPDVVFVDVAKIGGHERLITYEPGRLHWFDPESAAEHELVAVTSNFDPPRRDEIPHVDVTRDLNDDGRDGQGRKLMLTTIDLRFLESSL